MDQVAEDKNKQTNFGCSDSSCIFDPPKGMHTNGGCRCLKNVKPTSLRLGIGKKIYLLKLKYEKILTELKGQDVE